MRVEQCETVTRAEDAVRGGPGECVTAPPGPDDHAALIEPAMALMARRWQRERISIVTAADGRLPGAGSRKPGAGGRIAVSLRHAAKAQMVKQTTNRFTLSYDPAAPETARAALIAASASDPAGGWPIAADAQSLALLTLAERVAGSDIPVLLEGPTGTGKEVIARFVHRMSARNRGPFVAVNCAAMPETMLEGLLFGHRKGAFTGAGDTREGLFAAASGGTLLLDEIGELPLALQAKLLRTLQEGEVLPLGATKPVKTDLRVVAATNRTLSAEVAAGRFREDLLYRLNVFPLVISPLRDRPGDLAPLALGMLLRHACKADGPRWICDAALDLLERHPWPGNVRELENVIRRAILLAGDADTIAPAHIMFDHRPDDCRPDDCCPDYHCPVDRAAPSEEASEARAPHTIVPAPAPPASQLRSPGAKASSLSDVAFQSEAHAIVAALQRNRGHRARTARSLDISERTLRYRLASMRDSGLTVPGDAA